MKKSALAAVLALCALTGSAAAYENTFAGYAVKEKNPAITLEGQQLFFFSDVSDLKKLETKENFNFHGVVSCSAEDMEKVIGEKFSTAYFDEQYAKLEALQQGGLSLKTIPMPLLDMKRYQNISATQSADVLENQLGMNAESLDPEVTLVKVGRHKAINLQYLYKRGQMLISLDNTLVSANDRLYCLISMGMEPQEETAAAEEKTAAGTDTAAADEKSVLDKMTVAKFKKMMKAQPLAKKDLPLAAEARFRKSHAKFLKGFKTLVPTGGQPAPLQYTDTLVGKTVSLPDDWLYMKMNFAEKDVQGNIFCALPYPMLGKMAAAERNVGWYGFLENAGEDNTQPEGAVANSAQNEEKAKAKLKEIISKQLENFDTMLVTVSARSNKESFVSELTEQPEANTIAAEEFLRSGFKRWQTMGINEYLKLDDYKYDISITAEKALVDIWVRTTLLEQFSMDSKLRFAGKDNMELLLWQLQKTGADAYPQIEQALDKYQF